MTAKFKLTKLAAVVGVVLGTVAIAPTAQAIPASGEVQAVVLIQNFGLFNNATNTLLDTSNFSAFLALDDASVSATLNGVNAPQNTAIVGAPPSPPLDLLQAQIGSPYGENNFNQHAAPPAGFFARADQQLSGVLVTGIPAVPGPGNETTPASSKLVAEVGLNAAGTGSANTTSGTSGTVVFVPILDGIVVKINFQADPYLYAQLSPALVGRASQSLSFSLIDHTAGDAEVFSWSPDGGIGGISGGVELLDPISLNNARNANAITNGPNCFPLPGCGDGGFQTFAALTPALAAGHQYELTFSQTTTANLTVIPEPGTLALLGGALMAAGLGRFRKTRAS